MIRTWVVHTFTGIVPEFHLKVFALPRSPTQFWHACLPVFQFSRFSNPYLFLASFMIHRFRISLVETAALPATAQSSSCSVVFLLWSPVCPSSLAAATLSSLTYREQCNCSATQSYRKSFAFRKFFSLLSMCALHVGMCRWVGYKVAESESYVFGLSRSRISLSDSNSACPVGSFFTSQF